MNLSLLWQDPMAFVINLCYLLPCILLSLSVHEAAHAFAALKMGDESQRYRGRISINPLRHVEPLGFLMLLVAGFGWAKPVQVNMYNFRDSRKGMAVTAVAGPLANFVTMFLAALIGTVCHYFYYTADGESVRTVLYVVVNFCNYLALINAGLGLFNLIPIPPLDGSRVVGLFLPDRLYYRLMDLERYGFWILAAVLLVGNYVPQLDFVGRFLATGRAFLINGCYDIAYAIIKLFM